jgi:transposase
MERLAGAVSATRPAISDRLDAKLEEDWGIEMIAPNRKKRGKTQDGRPLRRYCRRWKVERLVAWLQNFRRLVVRYEFHAENFLAMAQLGCIMILLRVIMRCLLVLMKRSAF